MRLSLMSEGSGEEQGMSLVRMFVFFVSIASLSGWMFDVFVGLVSQGHNPSYALFCGLLVTAAPAWSVAYAFVAAEREAAEKQGKP